MSTNDIISKWDRLFSSWYTNRSSEDYWWENYFILLFISNHNTYSSSKSGTPFLIVSCVTTTHARSTMPCKRMLWRKTESSIFHSVSHVGPHPPSNSFSKRCNALQPAYSSIRRRSLLSLLCNGAPRLELTLWVLWDESPSPPCHPSSSYYFICRTVMHKG